MGKNTKSASDVTVVIPAKNEAASLRRLLPELRERYPKFELLVVDDGSSDDTREVCEACGARVVSLPYSLGNGGAMKTGVRHASNDTLVTMDADGQHSPEDVARLLEKLDDGYDMVVGARGWRSQANAARGVANTVYNWLAGWMVSQRVADLTSGFRAVRADKFKEFLHLLPNGFSYPTTITMAFFRAGYPLCYIPIEANRREGKSHVSSLQDGIRFLMIIFRVGTLYSPLKLFLPISVAFGALGCSYYLYTYLTAGRFTNMSALLMITSVLVFLIGLVSEQITSLIYQRSDH
jgi:glycosyltransferase involved in cell wall biosynthesis